MLIYKKGKFYFNPKNRTIVSLKKFSVDSLNFFLDSNSKTYNVIKKKGNNCFKVMYEITRNCNFNCKYCYLKKEKHLYTAEPIEKVINYIKYLDPFEVIITGGEPFSNKTRLFYLIRELHKMNVTSTIYSNGALIDNRDIKTLKKYNVNLFISLDTINKSNDIRQPEQLYTVMENIIKMKRKNINITIQSVINNKNKKDIVILDKFLKGINIPHKIGINNNTKAVKKFKSIYQKLGRVTFFNETPCMSGNSNIYIRNDGVIVPCTYLYSQKISSINKRISPSFNETTKYDNLEICNKCIFRFDCNRGCFARKKRFNLKYDIVREELEKPIFTEYLETKIPELILKSYYDDYFDNVSSNFFRHALLKSIDAFDLDKYYIIPYIKENELVGFSLFKSENNIGRIFYIYVDKKYRNIGLGTYLLQKTLNAFRSINVKSISLATIPKYAKFYLKNGFKLTNTIESNSTKLNLFQYNRT